MKIRLVPTACQHIRVEDALGGSLTVVTMNELLSPIQGDEDRVLARMKLFIKDFIAHGGSPSLSTVRTFLEDREF